MGFIVRCRVSGGVTGTRESVCKKDGQVITFPDHDSAKAYADKYNKEFGQNPYRTCDFRYWVEEVR